MTVPWWDLAANFTDELIILVLCVKKPSRRRVLHTRIHSEWLYINSAPRCILLCVFFRAMLPLFTSSVDSLLSLYFASWVVCICYVWQQHRFLSLPLKTNETRWKEKKEEENSGLFCCHWVNPVLSAFLISLCRKTKNSTGRRWHLLRWVIAVYDHRDLKILAEV